MAIGLNVKTDVKGLDELKKYIEYVKKFSTLKTDKFFQKYIQDKFLETVNRVSNERLPAGAISSEYISNNQIKPSDDGFILYNNTSIATDSDGYGGQFSIALAFEYGTGIIGQDNPKIGAWQYNIKGHIDGWWYPTNSDDRNPIKFTTKDGVTLAWTKGFEGYEVYRFTLEEIKNKLNDWVMNYKNDGGVSQ